LATGPVVIPPHAVVQEAVISNGRPLGANNRQPRPGRGNDPFRSGEHLQVGGLDLHPIGPPIHFISLRLNPTVSSVVMKAATVRAVSPSWSVIVPFTSPRWTA